MGQNLSLPQRISNRLRGTTMISNLLLDTLRRRNLVILFINDLSGSVLSSSWRWAEWFPLFQTSRSVFSTDIQDILTTSSLVRSHHTFTALLSRNKSRFLSALQSKPSLLILIWDSASGRKKLKAPLLQVITSWYFIHHWGPERSVWIVKVKIRVRRRLGLGNSLWLRIKVRGCEMKYDNLTSKKIEVQNSYFRSFLHENVCWWWNILWGCKVAAFQGNYDILACCHIFIGLFEGCDQIPGLR